LVATNFIQFLTCARNGADEQGEESVAEGAHTAGGIFAANLWSRFLLKKWYEYPMPLVIKRGNSAALESHLSGVVQRWVSSLGYIPIEEFSSPWGIADVVGIRPNIDRMLQRIRERHEEAIGDLRSILVLLAIPTMGSKRTVSLEELVAQYGELIGREVIERIVLKLSRKKIIGGTTQGRLYRIINWLPYHEEIISVELKLARVEEAIAQASRHKVITPNSYVGLPSDLAERLTFSQRRSDFESAGVGLLSVGNENCEVLIQPTHVTAQRERAYEIAAAENAWRFVLKTIQH
jgi:hypothetical protein